MEHEETTSLDPMKVKAFWEARGAKLGRVSFESIGNFEEDPTLLALKTKLEQECILPRLRLTSETNVLDLGAGVGQWTFRFAPAVRRVVAVEYASALAEIGKEEAARRQLGNVEYVVCPAEDYRSSEAFDVVFISGLFLYLTDAQVRRLLGNLRQLVKAEGMLFLRDGTSILPARHQIIDQLSVLLKERYSAVYRTAGEYVDLMKESGFLLTDDCQVFPEGCPLNKFPETRLRFYSFRPLPV